MSKVMFSVGFLENPAKNRVPSDIAFSTLRRGNAAPPRRDHGARHGKNRQVEGADCRGDTGIFCTPIGAVVVKLLRNMAFSARMLPVTIAAVSP
jgi:hypothetical protein